VHTLGRSASASREGEQRRPVATFTPARTRESDGLGDLLGNLGDSIGGAFLGATSNASARISPSKSRPAVSGRGGAGVFLQALSAPITPREGEATNQVPIRAAHQHGPAENGSAVGGKGAAPTMTPPTPLGGFTPAAPVISKMLPPTDNGRSAEGEGQQDMSIISADNTYDEDETNKNGDSPRGTREGHQPQSFFT